MTLGFIIFRARNNKHAPFAWREFIISRTQNNKPQGHFFRFIIYSIDCVENYTKIINFAADTARLTVEKKEKYGSKPKKRGAGDHRKSHGGGQVIESGHVKDPSTLAGAIAKKTVSS